MPKDTPTPAPCKKALYGRNRPLCPKCSGFVRADAPTCRLCGADLPRRPKKKTPSSLAKVAATPSATRGERMGEEVRIFKAVADRVYSATDTTLSRTWVSDLALIVSLTLDEVWGLTPEAETSSRLTMGTSA